MKLTRGNSMSEPVTHVECEHHRSCLETELRDALQIEREDREKDQAKIEHWLLRIEKRMDGMNSKLFAVVLEIAVGLILGILAYIGGKI